jgi:hypothetical protein
MIDIYITSFYRADMTRKSIELIKKRTAPGTYQLHIFDNGSDKVTRDYLYNLLENGTIVSLHLDSRNTGCLYNKGVFHAMTETKAKYYIVTDNDIYPPNLSPDWLTQMLGIMEKYPKLAFLTPQAPPAQLTGPEEFRDDVCFCQAVGNALKLVRREAYPFDKYSQALAEYGDDGMLSDVVRKNGWRVAFCRKIFFLHAGQCDNWGYKPEEIAKDPRKIGYGAPLILQTNPETYEPTDPKFVL